MSGFREGDKVRIIAEPNYSGDVEFAGLTGVIITEDIPPREDETHRDGVYRVHLHLDGESDSHSTRQFYGNDLELCYTFEKGDRVQVIASPHWDGDAKHAGLVGTVTEVCLLTEGSYYELTGIYTVKSNGGSQYTQHSRDFYGIDLELVVEEAEPEEVEVGTRKAVDYPVATMLIIRNNMSDFGMEEIILMKQRDNYWVYVVDGESWAGSDDEVDDLLSPTKIEVLLP